MRIGMLTGGGDCPGLNAVIRAVVRKGEREYGHEFIGFRHGWRGLIEDETIPLASSATPGHPPPGRHDPRHVAHQPLQGDGESTRCKATLARHGIDALVAIGGEDTLGRGRQARRLGVHVVGVPKTIDNDLSGTDLTFGFDTAVQIATDAIDRLHTTAESHDRVMVVEVMGRHAGWIASWSGIAGGADDHPRARAALRHRRRVRRAPAPPRRGRYRLDRRRRRGRHPEGGHVELVSGEIDEFGHVRLGGIGNLLAEIEDRTGFETRVTVLGHVQRGGTPTAFDRVLATRFGVAAIDAVHDGDFGTMVALQAGDIVRVPLSEAVGTLKTVDPALYHGVAEVFFAG